VKYAVVSAPLSENRPQTFFSLPAYSVVKMRPDSFVRRSRINLRRRRVRGAGEKWLYAHKPKATKKTYRAPWFRELDAKKAQVVLENTAVLGDEGARTMLNSINNSKAEPPSTTPASTRRH